LLASYSVSHEAGLCGPRAQDLLVSYAVSREAGLCGPRAQDLLVSYAVSREAGLCGPRAHDLLVSCGAGLYGLSRRGSWLVAPHGQDVWSCPRAHAAAFWPRPIGYPGPWRRIVRRPRVASRALIGRILFRCAQPRTRNLVLQSECAEGQNRTRTRPRTVPASARSSGLHPPVGGGFGRLLANEHGHRSSTGNCCGRRSPHLASTDEVDWAHVPRICRPPPLSASRPTFWSK
jgi:hypothetical protein